jgi:hypothetical protein
MPISKPFLLTAVAASVLLYGCGGSDDDDLPSTRVSVLSSRADMVSGGSALVAVEVPQGVTPSRIKVMRGTSDVTASFATQGSSIVGLVPGLQVGDNVISAAIDGQERSKLTLKNFSRSGPIISGPQQMPWLCETEKFKVPDGSTLGPAQDAACNAPTNVSYIYLPKDGKAYVKLPSTTSLPADLSQTTTSDGKTVNHIVRVETGTVNRGIYQFAVLHDPTKDPAPTPVAQHNGWNGKMVYVFGGSAAAGYHQGDLASSSPTEILLTDVDKLAKGFAVATSTMNIFGVIANDVVSAETTSMVKEIFSKTFGVPKYTIGTGGSGGSMQVHLVGNNYPGLLDGIAPGASFPDLHTTVTYAIDCAVLSRAVNDSGLPWTAAEKQAIAGFNTWATCDSPAGAWTNNFAPQWLQAKRSSIPLFPWRDGFLDVNNCSLALPNEWLYDAVANPGGIRCDIYQAVKTQMGVDPATGQPARAWDNIGLQYGLTAFQAGKISAEQFVVLNEKAGGYDNNGEPTATRTTASPMALQNEYRYGRVNNAKNLGSIPIVDSRTDPLLRSDVHDSLRSLAMRERLIRANGGAGNQVIVRRNGTPLPPGAGDAQNTDSFAALDRWVQSIKSDTKSYASPLEKVVANKPTGFGDNCQVASGDVVFETADISNSGRCGAAMPYYADPRMAAGGPLSGDILKCQLKPFNAQDYTGLSQDQIARLGNVFAGGVCDFSKPSVGNEPLVGTWLTFPSVGVGQPLN